MSIIESLRKLIDPAAVRDEQAERLSKLQTPVREDAGAPPVFACRVCGHQGPEPAFCPECLAETMRPTAAPPSRTTPPRAPAPEPAVEPVTITPDGTLDLHTFKPSEVRELLSEYLAACAAAGLRHVRVVHGKGTGQLKRTVEHALAREPLVESFAPADAGAGGWGATLVTLRAC